MKIAYLVLAHADPDMLSRLVGRLSDGSSKAFVHVDARANIDDFAAAFDPRTSDAVRAGRRIRIHWCGFSMVEATYNLLKLAFADPAAYDRFVLLSGADYPIKPTRFIREALAAPRNFLQVDRKLDPDGVDWFDGCANHPFLGELLALNPRTGAARLAGWARRLERSVMRPYPPGLSVYYGPAWWCLTRETVGDFVLHEREFLRIVRWFRWSRSPDEMVFQTMVKRQPHPNIEWDSTTAGCAAPEANSHALHYVDFQNANPDAPRTLDASDFDALKASGALFARKFSTTRSTHLLDRLDAEVLNR